MAVNAHLISIGTELNALRAPIINFGMDTPVLLVVMAKYGIISLWRVIVNKDFNGMGLNASKHAP